jgi:NAD(P)-dependent dehydrogenase (short-subunit alcohol dehydrogenase family)
MSETNILVIGANGGIGAAVVEQFAQRFPHAHIHAVSRKTTQFSADNIRSHTLQTDSDDDIKQWLKDTKITFKYAVGAMGVLHSDDEAQALSPEKKLEDINEQQLLRYFKVNSIVPSLWIKHLVRYMDKSGSAICFVSARVGSIEDNKIGGWYGYRASKAALNMLIKTADVEYRRRTKNTAFVSYHPGTVDTGLSKPFQSNVKSNKLFTPDFTAERLVTILAETDVTAGPYFLDWDSKKVPW